MGQIQALNKWHLSYNTRKSMALNAITDWAPLTYQYEQEIWFADANELA
jgi:hypothetical protein